MTDASKFIADLQRDLERHLAGEPVFHPLTPEQDAALDRLFAMWKPCVERTADEWVKAGILEPRKP